MSRDDKHVDFFGDCWNWWATWFTVSVTFICVQCTVFLESHHRVITK